MLLLLQKHLNNVDNKEIKKNMAIKNVFIFRDSLIKGVI